MEAPLDTELFPQQLRPLCRLEDIPDSGSTSFPGAPGAFTGLMAIRQGDKVFVYVNACPHIGTPLDWVPGRFLSRRSLLHYREHGRTFPAGVPAPALLET